MSSHFKSDASFRSFLWQWEQIPEKCAPTITLDRTKVLKQSSYNLLPKQVSLAYIATQAQDRKHHGGSGGGGGGGSRHHVPWHFLSTAQNEEHKAVCRMRSRWKHMESLFLWFFVRFGNFSTHHCLVVNLDHLVSCMDLLTLVCRRLQRQKKLEMKRMMRENLSYIKVWVRCHCEIRNHNMFARVSSFWLSEIKTHILCGSGDDMESIICWFDIHPLKHKNTVRQIRFTTQ